MCDRSRSPSPRRERSRRRSRSRSRSRSRDRKGLADMSYEQYLEAFEKVLASMYRLSNQLSLYVIHALACVWLLATLQM